MAIRDLPPITLDINNKYTVYADCMQNDDIILHFKIFDKSVVANLNDFNVRLKAFKRDNIPLIQETKLSITGNEVTIQGHKQLTTTSGIVKTELQFIDKSTLKKKSTFYLELNVTADVFNVSDTLSAPTCTLLEEMDNKLDQLNDAIDTAEKKTAEFQEDMKVIAEASEKANTLIGELEDSNNKLQQTINNSQAAKSDLETAINSAEDAETSIANKVDIESERFNGLIDAEIEKGNEAKKNLEDTYSTANDWLSKLQKENATTSQNIELLDNKNSLAETNKTALDEANAEAEAKLDEFKKFDTDGLVQLNQTMLNELVCSNELCNITFSNVGQYPFVQMLYYENGYGMGGFGQGAAGGTAPSCNLMQNKVIYTSDNTLRIYVPKDNFIKNNSVVKKNDNEYLVSSTDANDARCCLIILKETI